MSSIAPYYQLQYLYQLHADQMTEVQWLNTASPILRASETFPLTDNALITLLSQHYRQPLDSEEFERFLQQNQAAQLQQTDTGPIVVTAYRGEHGTPDPTQAFQSKLGSISFGSQSAARTYALDPNNSNDVVQSPRIIEATLTINNPVFNDPEDPFLELGHVINAIGKDKTKTIALEQIAHLSNTDNWHELIEELSLDHLTPEAAIEHLSQLPDNEGLALLYLDAYPVFDEPKYIEWFRQAGFDGVIQGGNGETAMEPEYKIFSPEQAQIVLVEPATPEPVAYRPRR